MLKFIEYLTAGLEMNFVQSDVRMFRRKYACEVFNKELLV